MLKIKAIKPGVLILSILVISAALISGLFWNKNSSQDKSESVLQLEPSVSIGCDRAIWNNTQLELQASTRNIDAPLFQWIIDDKIAGSAQKISQKFNKGEHKVTLNVSFDNKTLQANQSIVVIDSIEGITLRDSQASKNQWGFQTLYKGRIFGVKGVQISMDSSPLQEVNSCGYLATKALSAGKHAWRAEYQGKTIASGTFGLKEINEIKITKIDVGSNYKVGDTVNGKIVLKNTGSTTIKEFDIKMVAVNHKYEWMGDVARKEYSSQYKSEIKPGAAYELPIRITIPEKVSGIKPSGKYTITVNVILKGMTTDTKTVNTEVR